MCNCGCNTCKTKSTMLVLNENVAPKEILSEGLKYHIDNNRPLTNHLYRAGSESYFNLIAEARSLYSRGIIDVVGDDLEMLTETDLGHFGMFEGKKVPLDYPIELNEEMDLEDELANMEFGMDYDQLGPGEKEWVHDEIDNRSLNEEIDSEDFNNAKEKLSKAYEVLGVERGETKRGDKYIQINYIPKSSPQTQNPEWVKVFYDDNKDVKDITSILLEAKKKKKKGKNANKPIGKPMRSSSGGKAYKVYVKDPKTKKIKTVRFGSGGLRAKINDKKARTAFAKRHKCSQKKDRTKAGYWSCRLPRYAKLLGLKSSFSGFW